VSRGFGHWELIGGDGWRFDGGEWVLRRIVRMWFFCVQGGAGASEGLPLSVLCTFGVFQRSAQLRRRVRRGCSGPLNRSC
jgi:hypothetical protein